MQATPGRRTLFAASVLGALGVMLGAFAAHGLDQWLAGRGLEPQQVAERLAQAETAVRYHLLHALLLGLLAALAPRLPRRLALAATAATLAGILLFSGSLYLLVATDQTAWARITPLGGLSLIAGWIVLAIAAAKMESTS